MQARDPDIETGDGTLPNSNSSDQLYAVCSVPPP